MGGKVDLRSCRPLYDSGRDDLSFSQPVIEIKNLRTSFLVQTDSIMGFRPEESFCELEDSGHRRRRHRP